MARRAFLSVHGLLGAAAHGRVVGGDQALDALDDADAGDDAGADGVVAAPGGQRRQLQERRVGVEEQLDPLAGQQLAAGVVALDVLLAAAGQRLGVLGLELGELPASIGLRGGRVRVAVSRRGSRVPSQQGLRDVAGAGSAATRRGPWPAGRSGCWRRRPRRAARRRRSSGRAGWAGWQVTSSSAASGRSWRNRVDGERSVAASASACGRRRGPTPRRWRRRPCRRCGRPRRCPAGAAG